MVVQCFLYSALTKIEFSDDAKANREYKQWSPLYIGTGIYHISSKLDLPHCIIKTKHIRPPITTILHKGVQTWFVPA